MQDMQPMQPATPMQIADAGLSAVDDFDYALGCECADPSLQIERWMQEAAGGADPNCG